MTGLLLMALKLSVILLVFAIGLGSRGGQVSYLWQRPSLLLRSLLAMYLVVPLIALLVVSVFEVGPTAQVGLTALAVSAGAPLLSRRVGALGNQAYLFSLLVLSSLLAVLMVPVGLSLMARVLELNVHLTPVRVASILARAFVVPLLIGVLLRRASPALAARWAFRINLIAGAVLTLVGIALLIVEWRLLMEVSGRGFVALVSLLVGALLAGHFMAGEAAADRTTLAVSCATRHLGVALVVATSIPGPRAAVVVLTYLLGSTLVVVPYLRWRRHVQAPRVAPAPPPTRTVSHGRA